MPYEYGYSAEYGYGSDAGASAPSFSPTDVTGLWMWLDASQIEGLSDGDGIATWADAGSGAHDATQATGGDRPIYKTGIVNSLPVARFDGANSFFYLEDMSALTAAEAFVVVKLDNDPPSVGAGGFWLIGSHPGNSAHVPYTDGTIYDEFGSDTRKTTVNPTPSMASWRIYSVWSASGDWANALDGTQLYSTATNTVAFQAAPWFGRSDNSSYNLDGDVAEVIIYDNKVSSDDRAAIISYLSDKYGLGL